LGVLPDLVKVDTEGAERLVLKGATRIACEQRTTFLDEMHSNPELSMDSNGNAIIAWCHSNGYKAWYLKHKVELNDSGEIRNRGRCHLLLLPETAAFPSCLQHLDQGAKLEQVQICD